MVGDFPNCSKILNYKLFAHKLEMIKLQANTKKPMRRYIMAKYLKSKGDDEIIKETRKNGALITSEKQFDDNGFLI